MIEMAKSGCLHSNAAVERLTISSMRFGKNSESELCELIMALPPSLKQLNVAASIISAHGLCERVERFIVELHEQQVSPRVEWTWA